MTLKEGRVMILAGTGHPAWLMLGKTLISKALVTKVIVFLFKTKANKSRSFLCFSFFFHFAVIHCSRDYQTIRISYLLVPYAHSLIHHKKVGSPSISFPSSYKNWSVFSWMHCRMEDNGGEEGQILSSVQEAQHIQNILHSINRLRERNMQVSKRQQFLQAWTHSLILAANVTNICCKVCIIFHPLTFYQRAWWEKISPEQRFALFSTTAVEHTV